MKDILNFKSDGKSSNFYEHRVVQRKQTGESALYKVLDRDKFFGKHYSGQKNKMFLLDVSTTGCAFKVDREFKKGTFMEIEINKLSDEVVFDKPVVVSCETVYCIPIIDLWKRIGTKFVDISREDQEKIRKYSEKNGI